MDKWPVKIEQFVKVFIWNCVWMRVRQKLPSESEREGLSPEWKAPASKGVHNVEGNGRRSKHEE